MTRWPVIIVVSILTTAPASAWSEADWIDAGAFKGIDGTLCCGPLDCFPVARGDIEARADGSFYIRSLDETIPRHEAQWKSPDGRYWRCKKPNGQRRCFFVPPP